MCVCACYKCIRSYVLFPGDRIAIISQGSLLCCGSFEYLRHKYGRGHRLTLVTRSLEEHKSPEPPRSFTVTADIEDVDSDLPADSTDQPHPSTPTQLDLPRPSSPQDPKQKVMEFIKDQIVGAELMENRGRELHVLLPLLQARPRALAQLFAELDHNKDDLGVTSYGMTACSMEEVGVVN